MLIVWTELSRIEAGGSPLDPNDTLGIDALINISVDHANEALINSEAKTRMTNFHTAKLTGFSFSGSALTDLKDFINIVAIKNLRNQVGADVVTGILDDNSLFAFCGVGFVQTFPGCGVGDPNCGAGTSFNAYAYNLVLQICSIWDDTFTHELGHNLGGNHTRAALGTNNTNLIINNGYADAFAWEVSGFKSIISDSIPTTSRRLYFSNPTVDVGGIATGLLNEANNTRIIDLLSPVMSNFRTRPDLIFANGFE